MIRYTLTALVVATGALIISPVQGQNAPAATEPTRTWSDHAAMQDRLTSLARMHPDHAALEQIGSSLEGRELYVLRLARAGDIDADSRPAVLLVAGIDASMPHTSECAIDVASMLLKRAADGDEEVIGLLESNTVYVVPRVNPDGHEHNLTADVRHHHPRNMRSDDADRDRAQDEDGPEDLNGDGMITMMRIYDPRKADRVADADDPRLDTEPDREAGERPAFYLASEGYDNDEDGRHNEDGRGGVDLDMNFMHEYEAHADGSGRHQLSEPESLALLKYALDHQNIAAVVVYGRHDTLSNPPSANGRNDAGGPKTIESGDEALYQRISDRFVELTELEGVEQGDLGGSFVAWSYAQFGVPAFSTPLWTMPKPETPTDENADGGSNAEGDGAGDRPRGGMGGRSGGGFDRESMMEEFDIDGDGELDEAERDEMRAAMRERFGGRGGRGGGPGAGRGGSGGGPPAGRGGRGGGGRGDRGGQNASAPSGNGEKLTPSAFGDISQETIDELMESARERGMEVSEEQMSQITPEMIEMFAERSGITIRRVTKSTGDAGRSRRSGSKQATEADWLLYSDDQRNGEGFVEWTRIDHPDFDHVEVGGWAPGFRTTPPLESLDSIAEDQTAFIIDLAAHLPDVQLQDIEVEQLADGLWSIRASLVNEGRIAAGTAMAKRNRRARPWVVRLGTEPDHVLTGQRMQKVWSIDPDGGRHEMRWVVAHPDDSIELELFSEKYGGSTHTINLQSNEGGAQ